MPNAEQIGGYLPIVLMTPDPQPSEPGGEPEPVKEPDDGSTEAEEDEGEDKEAATLYPSKNICPVGL